MVDIKGKGKAVDADADRKSATYEEKDSAYFGYYSNLSHQAQMLQDSARTSIYQRAIKHIANSAIQGADYLELKPHLDISLTLMPSCR
jgi:type 1 glutamine amidotransferase